MKRVFLFIMITVFSSSSFSMDKKSDIDEFKNKAITYLHKHGTHGGKNRRMNMFTYIPDDHGIPFAVIKKGNRIQKESFTSHFACTMGLCNSVAQSVIVSDKKLGDEDVLLEEYLNDHFSSENHPNDLNHLISRFQYLHNLSLNNILQEQEEHHTHITHHILNYLDVDSVHKFFALVFLTSFEDSKAQNIALRLNKHDKLELVSFDFEFCFHGNGGWKSFLFTMPFLDAPLSPDVIKIIQSWTHEKFYQFETQIKKFSPTKNVSTGFYDFSEHFNRLKSIQEFLNKYPHSTPRDILFYAFFKDPSTADKVLKRLEESRRVRESYWEKDPTLPLGEFFKTTEPGDYSDEYEGYVGAIFTYNEQTPPGTPKTFEGFLNFIPKFKTFNKEKLADYKTYIKEKFHIDINEKLN